MKTPEQLASQIATQFDTRDNREWKRQYNIALAAIEADRAQRAEPAVTIFHSGPPDEVAEYVGLVAEQISEGYTSGGVYGGSGIYWESEL